MLRGRCKKKSKNKLTSVSFMYVCVAENAELLVFFTFFTFPIDNSNSPTHPQTVINHKN